MLRLLGPELLPACAVLSRRGRISRPALISSICLASWRRTSAGVLIAQVDSSDDRIAARRAFAYGAAMNRVLLVCGSLQRSSANRAALDVAGAALSASGVEAKAFDGLGSIPPLNLDRIDQPGEAVLAFR